MAVLAASESYELISRTHEEIDLSDRRATSEFFMKERPDYVVMAAAKVGGLLANANFPADFLHINLAIQLSMFEAAYAAGIERMIFLGSSCIYPLESPQPIREEYFLAGSLEPTSRPYAVAKIAGVESCWSFNRQYQTRYLALMPSSLYGPGDNYHPQHSHVLPALVRRFHEAKVNGAPSVVVWGSGKPRREFMYSSDLGEAIAFLLGLPDEVFNALTAPDTAPLINVGVGEDITIRELTQKVKSAVGYNGDLIFDTAKPDGALRKLLDVTRLHRLGWKAKTSIEVGLGITYRDYLRRRYAS
jgi:GDP-L-fucose synthase